MKRKLINKIDIQKIWLYLFLIVALIVIIGLLDKSLILSLIIFGLIILISKKVNIPKPALFLFLAAFILRLIIVLTIKTPPISDFKVLLEASQDLMKNNYSFSQTSYFQCWTYQIGFVFIQSLFLRVCNSVIFLKIINCLISAGIVTLIYLISKEFVDKASSKAAAIIYMIMPFTLTYVTVLTNQHLSSLLIYLGLYILISKKVPFKELTKYLLVSILLTIANIIRPESIIPLFSIILYLIITIKKENIKENIKKIFVLVGTYFLIGALISSLFSISGYAPGGLKNGDPHWKFVLGLNHESKGTYNNEDLKFSGNAEKSIEVIKDRLFTSPSKLYKLFLNKIKIFWLQSTLYWSFFHVENPTLCNIVTHLTALNNSILKISYILMLYGIFKYIKKKNYNEKIIILVNQVFVTFGVYLLIEIQPRYAYHIQITVIILASLAISEIINKIDTKYKKVK